MRVLTALCVFLPSTSSCSGDESGSAGGGSAGAAGSAGAGGGSAGNHCGGPCDYSDPFIVLRAEKHDAGSSFPSYSGWLDELRISSSLRYAQAFTPPAQPFTPDANSVGPHHFDEGGGTDALDSSGAAGGPSHGKLSIGGSPPGPEWSPLTPF